MSSPPMPECRRAVAAVACADPRASVSSPPPSPASGYQCCPGIEPGCDRRGTNAASAGGSASAVEVMEVIAVAKASEIPIDDFAVPMMLIIENGKLVPHKLNDEGHLVCERPSGCTHGCAPHQQRYNAAS